MFIEVDFQRLFISHFCAYYKIKIIAGIIKYNDIMTIYMSFFSCKRITFITFILFKRCSREISGHIAQTAPSHHTLNSVMNKQRLSPRHLRLFKYISAVNTRC